MYDSSIGQIAEDQGTIGYIYNANNAIQEINRY